MRAQISRSRRRAPRQEWQHATRLRRLTPRPHPQRTPIPRRPLILLNRYVLMDNDRGESAFTRDQMEQLVRVIVEIGSDLDLDVTLHRIVSAAMELTGARYGALGIRASDGALTSFVHAGLDADTARRL